jgi:hypothetical protein
VLCRLYIFITFQLSLWPINILPKFALFVIRSTETVLFHLQNKISKSRLQLSAFFLPSVSKESRVSQHQQERELLLERVFGLRPTVFTRTSLQRNSNNRFQLEFVRKSRQLHFRAAADLFLNRFQKKSTIFLTQKSQSTFLFLFLLNRNAKNIDLNKKFRRKKCFTKTPNCSRTDEI